MTKRLPDEILKIIPKESYKLIPFALPPVGIQPNFDHPESLKSLILGLTITFLVVATAALAIRIYTNIVIQKKWHWDDFAILLGFVFSIVHFAGLVLGCTHGAVGMHSWEVHLDRSLSNENILSLYLMTTVISPAIGFTRLGLFIQYYRFFKVLRYVRITVYIVATATGVVALVLSITTIVLASPWPGETLVDMILSKHFYETVQFLLVPGGAFSLLVDLVLLILPIPAIWSLQVSTRKRLSTMAIFAVGVFAVIACTLNLYYRQLHQTDGVDPFWKTGHYMLWGLIEAWCGILASCMPSVKRFCSYYNCPRSVVGSSSSPVLPQWRIFSNKSTKEKLQDENSGFGQWGYRSDVRAGGDILSLERRGSIREGIDTIRLKQEVFVVRDSEHAV